MNNKDTILFIGELRNGTIDAFDRHNRAKSAEDKLKIALIVDSNKAKKSRATKEQYAKKKSIVVISCNFRSRVKVRKALQPIMDKLAAVVAQYEDRIPELKKIIPHVPYLPTPTMESLDWATDKLIMRRLIDTHDSSLTPKFLVAKDASLDVIERVSRIGYPVVVKPAGLGGSRLVSMCYHEEELQHVLKKTFRKLQRAYRDQNGRGEPQVIIEQVMEGVMYSVDGYVNSKGKVTLCPPVHVKTGKEIGFDDFFGYRQLTPTLLSKRSIADANEATIETVKALSLRSTTIHCELFKTEHGWKIIELGPRMGGYREVLYELSYGIDHIMNDVLIRMGRQPVIPKKLIGHTVYMKFYAKEEGMLTKVMGVAKIKKLESFVSVIVNKNVGDEALYAKSGDGPVVKLVLCNKERSGLLADIRRAEQSLDIQTKPAHVFRKQMEQTADAIWHPIEDVEFMGKKAVKKVKDKVSEVIEETFDQN